MSSALPVPVSAAAALLLCGAIALSIAAPSAQDKFVRVGSIPGPAAAIRARGAHLFVAAGRTFVIYDVSKPDQPAPLGSQTFSEEIWSFRLHGTLAYVGANFAGLAIVDVSDPAAPRSIGSFKTPGQAKIGAVAGTHALVIDHMEGVVFADVSDPRTPAPKGSFFLDGYARDVVAAGNLAIAVDSPTGLYVFDLSKPALEPVASLQSGTAVRAVEYAEQRKLAVLVGGGSLQPYDLSNPAAPERLPPYRTPGGAVRVALSDTVAYVADGREGLQVVDLADPRTPRLVGGLKTAAPARDVAVAGDLVFLVVGTPQAQEILILRRAS